MSGIVLFDGVCNFCDASVQFIIKRDPNAHFKFAALQSEAGEKLQRQYEFPQTIESLVLIENDKVYTQSTGALRIARKLDGLWKFFYIAIIVPAPLRNTIYKVIARNRYKWFGKKDVCMLPTKEQRERFL